jgi:TRAP-type C4-dicarboxylate transport system substrate-binding protein
MVRKIGPALAFLMTLVTISTLALQAEAQAQSKIQWKAQAGMSTNSWSYLYHFKAFADRVNARSEGRLEIKIFPPDAIVGAYEMFDAVRRNAVQVGMGVGGYNLKHVPEAGIEQGLPGTFETSSDALNFVNYYQDGKVYDLINASYMEQGAYLLRSFGYSPQVIISKKPIKNIAEVKGLKLRTSGEYQALAKNLGASPVTLAPAEVVMAIQTGTIDGVIFPAYTIGTFKLWDVAKGLMGPSFGQTAGDIYINLETWKKLPNDLKWLVEEAALYANHYYQAVIEDKIRKILKEAKDQHGVTIVNMTPADYQLVLEASKPIRAELATKTQRSAEIIKIAEAYVSQ